MTKINYNTEYKCEKIKNWVTVITIFNFRIQRLEDKKGLFNGLFK